MMTNDNPYHTPDLPAQRRRIPGTIHIRISGTSRPGSGSHYGCPFQLHQEEEVDPNLLVVLTIQDGKLKGSESAGRRSIRMFSDLRYAVSGGSFLQEAHDPSLLWELVTCTESSAGDGNTLGHRFVDVPDVSSLQLLSPLPGGLRLSVFSGVRPGWRCGKDSAPPPFHLFISCSKIMYAKLDVAQHDGTVGAESVTWHRHRQDQFVGVVRDAVQHAVKNGASGIAEIAPRLFDLATDTRMLRHAWDDLAEHGGQAPGRNGRRYGDLDSTEVWSLLRAMNRALRAGTYRPGDPLRCKIPKDRLHPERGHRTLCLPDIEDRVVQRAVMEILQPLRDPFLSEGVFGFRPKRSRLHALAQLEKVAVEDGRFVVVSEDITNAFDNVPIGRLRDVIAMHIPSPKLVDLIVMLASAGGNRGIQQGGPLSPYALNEYLDHHLDRRWRAERPDVPLIRYADDILVLCRNKREAAAAWRALRDRLRPAGMPIKGTDANTVIHDLRKGGAVEWLGFRIARGDGQLEVRIADRAWERLMDRLILAHGEPNSPLYATSVIQGWLQQMGPAYQFEDRQQTLARLTSIASSEGFDEIPASAPLLALWREAWERWLAIRDGTSDESVDHAMGIDKDWWDEGIFDDGSAPFD